ncbi:unknown [Bacteroides stercoris CAG:120]|nr:unknown [Bacteroides stercoris CAG:120]
MHGTHAGTPFFIDNAAFLVYFFGIQSKVVAPVVKNQQTRVDSTRSIDRYIGNVINRFVYGRVGIQVFTELHADAFQVLYQGLSGEVSRSVETHVFQEVGKTALVVLFLYGAYFLGNVEVGAVSRKTVFTDVIGQPVVQLTDTYILIDRNRRQLLRRYLLEVAAYD